MKLFRTRRKPENGDEEQELVLDTDVVEEDFGQKAPEALGESALAPEAGAAVQADIMPSDPGDPLVQLPSEPTEVMPAEGKPTPADPASPPPEDPLDTDLLDLFREAKNEAQETTLASELPDIPIQDLLSDLVSVSQELGITPRVRAEPRQHKTSGTGPELREGGK